MSVKELKNELATLSTAEQAEIAAFLFHLRHRADVDYQSAVQQRMEDKERSHWLTPEEFEGRLNGK